MSIMVRQFLVQQCARHFAGAILSASLITQFGTQLAWAQEAPITPPMTAPENPTAPAPSAPAASRPIEREGVAPSAENNALADEMTPELAAAVERGLAHLAQEQNEDGSFGNGNYARNVAITSLACIAFMADGNLPGRGRYGPQVERGLRHVLDQATDSGLIAGETATGPMYGHGFATLFLGEVYGMTQGGGETTESRRLHEALVKAVRLIEQTQNPEGGWRYNPVPHDADSSVTICQVMGLRAARNAGIEVSKDVIDKAVRYVRQAQNGDGGFRYQLDMGPSAWPRSAAGVATLYYAGIYRDASIDRGLEYLKFTAMPGQAAASRAHYYYGHYYAVQAMYLAGGEHWSTWWPAIRTELLGSQREDGSWEDRSVGSTYATAMSLIILQMPKRYLPIFQK
jgi:Prenyltransferase and squalene oxidase repeat